MADYLTNTADMTIVADAIRAKGGTAEPLEFPQGMADAVAAIPSGGDYAQEDGLVKRTLTSYTNNRVEYVGNDTFRAMTTLKKAVFLNAKEIGIGSFTACTGMKSIAIPMAYIVKAFAFDRCSNIQTVDIPYAIVIALSAFDTCNELARVDIGAKAVDVGYIKPSIAGKAFANCPKLTALIIRRTDKIYPADASNIFYRTPIESGTGYIYVPKALVEQYKAATNWVTYASQIRAIEDYPEITGGAK